MRSTLLNNHIENNLFFLGRFLRNPRQVASIVPSSRFLTQRMFDGISLNDGDTLIELGPGTGAFTQHVLTLREHGVRLRYLGIERDRGMYASLRRRFPDLEFVLGDAVDVRSLARAKNLGPAKAVISGLPLILMSDRIMREIIVASAEVLDEGGLFRTFSYVHSYPSRGAAKVRRLIQSNFASYELGRPVVRNLPPALLLSGHRPRRRTADPALV